MTDQTGPRQRPANQPIDRPPLDRQRLRATAPWRVEVVEASPSTNALVAARARVGEPPGLVVAAEHQTAGRGRLDRSWVTPARAALTFSALVAPAVPQTRWAWLPLLTGVAVVEGVAAAGGPACGLKWPNDVMYGGRKVAGLLAEMVEGPPGRAVVLGVGLNVTTAADELPVETATSLLLEGFSVDRTTLLTSVLDRLASRLADWSAARGDAASGLLADYQRLCVTVGQRVRVHLPLEQHLEGVAVAVAGDGALVVDGPEGRRQVSAGDVVHVRPGAP